MKNIAAFNSNTFILSVKGKPESVNACKVAQASVCMKMHVMARKLGLYLIDLEDLTGPQLSSLDKKMAIYLLNLLTLYQELFKKIR